MSQKYVTHNGLLPFYLSWQLKPASANYNLCFSYQLKNKKEGELLVEKLQQLINLKAYLRQTFTFEEGKLIASIHETLPARINFLTSSIINFPEIEKQLIIEPHDIHINSAIQLTIIDFDDVDFCVAFFNIHHILMDGNSLDAFVMELNLLLANEEVVQETYEEYILKVKDEDSLQEIPKNPSIENYLKQANYLLDNINFSSTINTEKITHYTGIMPDYIQKKLHYLSQESIISVFNLLLVAQGIFLAKIFNQDATLITYPVNTRKDKTINGCFVNVIAFPLIMKNNDSYLSLIDSLKEKIAFFRSISKIKFYEALNVEFLPSFAYSNIAQTHPLIIRHKSYTAKNYSQIANSMLSIKYREVSGKLYFSCDMAINTMPEYLAQTLLSRFFHYLNRLLNNPEVILATTNLTFPKEKKQLLSFNNTNNRYPKHKTIHKIFEEQAEKIPNNVALVYKDSEFTYAEVNNRANQLAHYLISQYKVKPNELVAICFDRNLYVVIAMLAILKAGAAYVSLSSKSLSERTAYILKNSKARILLTNCHILDKISRVVAPHENLDFITIDSQECLTKLVQQSAQNPQIEVNSSHLAHVIYTSGTTSLPKGVMIEHRGVVSLVKNATYLKVNQFDTFALFSDLTFDASTFEIWGALLNGAKLFIPYNRLELLSDAEKFRKNINQHHITVLLLTKTLFDQLFYLDETIFSGLTYLLVGGEPLNKTLIYNLAASQHKPIHLINAYGPTENTTISCTYTVQENEIRSLETIPIGSPLSNRSAYVLDLHQNLLPIGAVGELYVGGSGLARGYWDKTELTSQKFITNPFQLKTQKIRNENSKLYKTGDLARLMLDGNIEYIGRSDFQIKIRGYRVEPTEIENRLMAYPNIKQAAVFDSKHFDATAKLGNYLIAYYVSKIELDDAKLRDYLSIYLPEYMLPSVFVHLNEFPTTVSGKLDKKALPLPTYLDTSNYIEPRDDKEKLICKAFGKVLGIEKVSIQDDFFYLGGNSLKAIELVASLQANFKVTVADVFNMRDPETIAKNIHFSRDNLKSAFSKVKFLFESKNSYLKTDRGHPQEILTSYQDSINRYPASFNKKSINFVLLTGATGYLGCNILREILHQTKYNLFLLIRADSDEKAFYRINKKFQFYFNEDLNDFLGTRIFVFASNLEKNDLGLARKNYQLVVDKTDSIIHAAALTKHYGEEEKFYLANVQATINLLELSKLTRLKDFHHISTVSVLDNSYDNQRVFTEDDVIEELDNQSNLYIKSKHAAEKQVINYKKSGINANIYRVGNLAYISTNYRVQENIEDSAFFNRLKCFIALKTAVPEIGIEEISAVDLTAQAIVKIFDKQELSNSIYHVFNPHLCNISDFLSQLNFVDIKLEPINNFLDMLIQNLDNPDIKNQLIMRFILDQGWSDGKLKTINYLLQDRTHAILDQLGFKWPKITQEIFSAFIRKVYFYNTINYESV